MSVFATGKARGWRPGRRVLLVEDNQLNAEIAAELLRMPRSC